MKEMILDLKAQGKTVVMCSHQLDDVQDVCDRIAILYEGELKELGRVDSLLKVRDVTDIQAKGISQETEQAIMSLIEKDGGELVSMGNRHRLWNDSSSILSKRAKPILAVEYEKKGKLEV